MYTIHNMYCIYYMVLSGWNTNQVPKKDNFVEIQIHSLIISINAKFEGILSTDL